MNEKTVIDVDQTQVDAIKNKPLKGYVCLQNHGGTIAFRELRVKVIEPPPAVLTQRRPFGTIDESRLQIPFQSLPVVVVLGFVLVFEEPVDRRFAVHRLADHFDGRFAVDGEESGVIDFVDL